MGEKVGDVKQENIHREQGSRASLEKIDTATE